ncbi:hypothetical protein DXV24_23015 [Escherichia albertii]|nr:hypothetical protein [Escherichia albertii]
METVWIAGCSSYETTGVIHLLRSRGISAGLFRPGERPRAGDTLILCFSSAPLLGWWRYMKITQWVVHRYDIRLIVLCPAEVYQASIIYGRNTVAVNGERSCIYLSRSLQQAMQCYLSEEMPELHRECRTLFFLEEASLALQILPARESDCPAARKEYYRRERLVQRLGFTSLMKLKVFMVGFVG